MPAIAERPISVRHQTSPQNLLHLVVIAACFDAEGLRRVRFACLSLRAKSSRSSVTATTFAVSDADELVGIGRLRIARASALMRRARSRLRSWTEVGMVFLCSDPEGIAL